MASLLKRAQGQSSSTILVVRSIMGNYLVIGGTSGIGKELTSLLHKQGHQLFVSGRANEADNTNGNYLRWDANDDVDLTSLPDKLDGLVYCPGTINLKPFHRLSAEEFADDWKVNVYGAIKVIQAALSKLKAAGSSSVVVFSTVAVSQGMPFHTSIAAAKGALEALIRSLAAEYAPAIRFNCIAPSLTDTPLAGRLLGTDEKRLASGARHPLKRVGTPKDHAAMASFLLSEDASWISGQVIGVDGGMSKLRSL